MIRPDYSVTNKVEERYKGSNAVSSYLIQIRYEFTVLLSLFYWSFSIFFYRVCFVFVWFLCKPLVSPQQTWIEVARPQKMRCLIGNSTKRSQILQVAYQLYLLSKFCVVVVLSIFKKKIAKKGIGFYHLTMLICSNNRKNKINKIIG